MLDVDDDETKLIGNGDDDDQHIKTGDVSNDQEHTKTEGFLSNNGILSCLHLNIYIWISSKFYNFLRE